MALVTYQPELLADAYSDAEESPVELPSEVIIEGVITMQDIIEQLLNQEIFDEDDYDRYTQKMIEEIIANRTIQVMRPLTMKSYMLPSSSMISDVSVQSQQVSVEMRSLLKEQLISDN